MIPTKVALVLVPAALAVGVIAGGAGTIAARDPDTGTMTTSDCIEHMQQHGSGMMGGSSGMMGGSSGMMGGSTMLDWMLQHHMNGTQEPTR